MFPRPLISRFANETAQDSRAKRPGPTAPAFLKLRHGKEDVEPLSIRPELVLVDGNQPPQLSGIELRCIVGGDASEPAIAAASILAKVDRDGRMQVLHQRYPDYGFDRHKGYPTALHRAVLLRLGPTPEHRRSFAPVRQLALELEMEP